VKEATMAILTWARDEDGWCVAEHNGVTYMVHKGTASGHGRAAGAPRWFARGRESLGHHPTMRAAKEACEREAAK
jgi:hypothetical protein